MKRKSRKTENYENFFKRVKDMSATIQSFKVSLDRQEQYSRRNYLLIHGLPENRNENTDQIVIEILKEKMGEEINEVDLDRPRRLGTPKYDKVRPILVKIHKIHDKK